jgi:hypothetical protein
VPSWRYNTRVPGYAQLLNALTWMGHAQNLRRVAEDYVIDLYLRPPVSHYRLLDYSYMDRIVRDANVYTCAAISQWAARNPALFRALQASPTGGCGGSSDGGSSSRAPGQVSLPPNDAAFLAPRTRLSTISSAVSVSGVSGTGGLPGGAGGLPPDRLAGFSLLAGALPGRGGTGEGTGGRGTPPPTGVAVAERARPCRRSSSIACMPQLQAKHVAEGGEESSDGEAGGGGGAEGVLQELQIEE